MSIETKIVRCSAKRNDGSRCTREKEVPINFKKQWRCWQHPPPGEQIKVNRGGRPSKYDPSIIPKVEEWVNEGLTDYEISKRLGINASTLYDWKKKYPKFSKSLKKSKAQADFKVEDSLFKRANGYTYDEVTQELVENPKTGEVELKPVKVVTKEVKPDVTAQIFWLKNRQPEKWKDKKDIDVTSGGKEISSMTAEEREKRRKELRAKLGDD
ncbi:transposase [Halonatronum saccharophilum]|uniref:transposase n=1 Tax=Halonatronum saccharophilum TaxID=150060 RepID=UPI0004BBAB6D|nr:transposase [Halonatronum saccharophilum]